MDFICHKIFTFLVVANLFACSMYLVSKIDNISTGIWIALTCSLSMSYILAHSCHYMRNETKNETPV